MEPVASHGAPVATATPPPTAGVVSSHAAPTATATWALPPVTSATAQAVIDAWSRGTSDAAPQQPQQQQQAAAEAGSNSSRQQQQQAPPWDVECDDDESMDEEEEVEEEELEEDLCDACCTHPAMTEYGLPLCRLCMNLE